jgi:NTP pyrophosphatase (non-canonical NTP hydrolase)
MDNKLRMSTSLYKEEPKQETEVKDTVFDKIRRWGKDRNFYGEGGATVQSQFVKLSEELGELAGNISRGKDCTDDLGDMVVVLTHIAKLQGKTIEECIEHSYNDIKDRKGQFREGSFIKEADLEK